MSLNTSILHKRVAQVARQHYLKWLTVEEGSRTFSTLAHQKLSKPRRSLPPSVEFHCFCDEKKCYCRTMRRMESSTKVGSLPTRQFSNESGKQDDSETTSADSSISQTQEEPRKQFRIPGAQKGGRKLAIVFTCTVCNTRAAKQFTEQAYTQGVVLVTCPGCNNKHLIADNLGFFSDEDGGWNIEKAMAKLGKNVNVVNDDNVFELSVEELYGEEQIQKVVDEESSDTPKA